MIPENDGEHSGRWYVLRVWFERDGDRLVWRASVRENALRTSFSSPKALLAYLSRSVDIAEEPS
ncbi:hypothetical protein DES52_110148 [Deinococcus yavapaiensis KR-236]|uniref:Uncharacterized protein n=1 Tax=Deinococcus yavapaiensis KR-236 TaxID=694435 RepID=A0A318SAA7_9DEIO|nr:hypothetical protein DES52_110148 [Deinococcus yavapaiensis KR-236]